MRRVPSLLLVLLLVLSACRGDDQPELGSARVTGGEVVQTVAAAATLEPTARVTVTAPFAGEVLEVLVEDGDTVQRGDALVRLSSESLDQQLGQAEAAVAAADALAGAASGAGMDLSPVLGTFRSQLEAIFPPVLGALRTQLEALEAASDAATAVSQAAEEEGLDADPAPVVAALEAQAAEVRARLAEAESGYRRARTDLAAAEQQAASAAASTEASQRAAVAAQREQAELALAAAEARADQLVVRAPTDGVVELARASAGDLGGGLDLGGLGDLGGVPGAEDLLGGGGGAQAAGPLSAGVAVRPGQPLLTVFDLSGFTVLAEVDELDVVEVVRRQRAAVLIDAFPDLELEGTVQHVAIAPERRAQGGVVFPVTITLREVPEEVSLRVGLTASVEIEVRRVDADLVVPTSALLRRGEDEVVYVVRDGRAVEVPVAVTAIGDEDAAVAGDLQEGERVITTGVEGVSDGDEVRW